MKYSVEKAEKYTLLTPEEEKIDSLKAPQLKTEFITLFQAGTKNLILDMSNVKYVDSSGLSSILVAKRLTDEAEGHFVIASLNDHVEKLIKISKLENVLNILPTKEEAVESVFLFEIENDLGSEE